MSKYNKEEQWDAVIAEWTANPLLNYQEIAERCGISDETFLRMRQTKEFMDRYHAQCRVWYEGLQAMALENVTNSLMDGDVKVSTWLLENVGGFKAANQVEVSSPTSIKIQISE